MQTSINPIRVTLNHACQALAITREGLRQLMAKDPTFPKPYKAGTTKQAAVYFDYAELVQWHNKKKQSSTFA